MQKMMFKLLGGVITRCSATTHKSHELVSKFQFSCSFLVKRQFSSDKNPDDLFGGDAEKLLKASSPLRSSNLDEFWSTSPYPQGTVFREYEDRPNENTGVNKTVILFPGQGNQFVGMARNLTKYPVAMDMFHTASAILGYNLLKICMEGPEVQLNSTKYCQPATFVCSLASLEKIKDEKPWVISNCVAVCGYSLGELTALVFAGCMNFEKGLNLVKVRAEAMQQCSENARGGMLTIFTGPRGNLRDALSDSLDHCREAGISQPHCKVASFLFPNCKVIGGNMEALKFIRQNARKYGIVRCSLLPVSGAFHTSLMKEAEIPFIKKLETISLNDPIIKVYSNVTSLPYKNANHIKKVLPKQIYYPVKWEQIMQRFLGKEKFSLPYLYECGPGNSLTSVAIKINGKVSGLAHSIEL